MQEWIRKANWYYDKCVKDVGSDYDCYPVYSIARLALLSIFAIAMVLIVRRAYYGWKGEESQGTPRPAGCRRPGSDGAVHLKGEASDATNLPHE
jgi:hypothetical protein